MSLPTNYKSSGGFDANGQKVTNLADATSPQDAMNLRTFDAKNTVQPYTQAKTYNPDFLVEFSGQIWKCIGTTTGQFDKTKWTAIRGTENWIRITGSYTAVSMDTLYVDTTLTPIVITLPASPKSGDYVRFIDAGNADKNQITIVSNGSTIDGVAGNSAIVRANSQITAIYLGGTWVTTFDLLINRVRFLTASSTLASNVMYTLLVSASFNVTLPSNPKKGDWVSLTDQLGTVGSNPITVLASDKQINGQNSFVINQKKASMQLIYDGAGWITYALTGDALLASKNLSDIQDKPTARSSLGLGSIATYDTGTAAGQVRLNSQNDLAYQTKSNILTNLSQLVLAANKLVYSTGVDTVASTDFTAIARQLLAAGTDADMRTVLQLGTAATKTVGTAAGNLMQVGAFGLGGNPISGGVDINTYTTSGFYLTPSSDVLNLPTGWLSGRNSVLVSGALPYVTQVIIQTPTDVAAGSKMAFRYGTAVDTWSTWYELGVATGYGTAATRNVGTGPANLIEVQNSFGLGSAVATYVGNIDDVATIPRGWVGVDSANGTTGTLPYANGILQTVGSATPGNIRQVFHQITKLSSTSNKTFVRDIFNSTVGPWKTIAYRDDLGSAALREVGTANTNVMEVGAFGLGSSSTSYSGDLNLINTTQFTYVTTSATNTPNNGSQGILTHIQAKDGFGTQEFISFGVTYRRYLVSGSWSAWAISSVDSTGEIVVSSTDTALPGTMKANGAAVSRTVYANLFERIGTTFGAGDGSTTFNLPDLRGEVIRGWDDGRGIDTGRVFGSLQLDQFQGHMFDIAGKGGSGDYVNSLYGTGPAGNGPGTNMNAPTAGATRLRTKPSPISDGINDTPRVGTETRARNVALLFCIRY